MTSTHAGTPCIALLLPDLRGGGAERITVNLANNLAGRGVLVDMVLLSATGPFLELLHPAVRVVDLKVNRMRGLLPPLIRYLRRTRPDAILASMWPLTVLAVLARRLALVSTRLVLAEHNTWSASLAKYSSLRRLVIRGTMRFFFPGAEAVVAVSNGAADDLARFAGIPRDSITTIYNPVIDPTLVHVYEGEAGIPGIEKWYAASFRVLTVGTLKEQKNHELLLRAFAVLVKRINAQLLILGEGHLRPKLEELADELGIKENVSMPGFANDPTNYYKNASLFTLSSDWEGLPTVLIEALALGTPAVSTDCPSGPREILCGGKFGRLVPVGDAEALAAAMAESLSTTHDREALKARAQDFSIEKAADRYLDLLFPSPSKEICL